MSFEDFLDTLNEEQRQMARYLRRIILEAAPEIEEKFRYRLPFYYRHHWVCYLRAEKNGLDLTFLYGQELSNHQGLLDARGRTQVSSLTFYRRDEIPEETLYEILQEALLLDEER